MISVAIATLDRPRHVERLLSSLLAGSQLPREIIVADQSQGDSTRDVVRRLDDPLVRYVLLSSSGVSRGRNAAAAVAGGEYVVFLDDDGEVEPHWLASVLATLNHLEWPDALFGAIRAPDGTVGGDVLPVSTFEPAFTREWTGRIHPNRLGHGGHMVIRRETLASLGGFDERLGPGGALRGAEDMDLNHRLLGSGARVASTPTFTLIHHHWRAPAAMPEHFEGYNFGHSAFCAKHLRAGDLYALGLFVCQIADDARMLASAVRRRSRLRARVAMRRAVGTWAGLVAGWRAYGAKR